METKYELTIEQIQTIIEYYKLGEYCRNNCYGCCGSDNYHSHCKDCVPKMKKHIEEMTTVTLEQVKKMWKENGWKVSEDGYFNTITFIKGEKGIEFDIKGKTYFTFQKELELNSFDIDCKIHDLITKTFKALGWYNEN